MRWLAAALLALAVAACPRPQPGPNPPPPPSAADAGPATSDCKRACDHGRALGCATAAPSAGGSSCEEICALAAEGGLSPSCRITARDCAAFDGCR